MATQSTTSTGATSSGTESLGVQELIDRLKADGVSRGQLEAETLVAEARKQSMAILDAAKQEADQILSKARLEAKQIEENGKQALTLATRDATLKLKESFSHEFQKKFAKLVGHTLQDNEFLKQLILQVAGKAMPNETSQHVQLLLPASKVTDDELKGSGDKVEEGTLAHFVLSLAADQLREGFTFGAADTLTEGVRIRLTDKDVEIDLSDATISALLLRFLAPRFRALLDSNH